MTCDTFFLSSLEKNKSSLIYSSIIFSASSVQPWYETQRLLWWTHTGPQCLLAGTGKRCKPSIKQQRVQHLLGKDWRLCWKLSGRTFLSILGNAAGCCHLNIWEWMFRDLKRKSIIERRMSPSLQRFEGLQRQTLSPNFGVFPALWWGKSLSE